MLCTLNWSWNQSPANLNNFRVFIDYKVIFREDQSPEFWSTIFKEKFIFFEDDLWMYSADRYIADSNIRIMTSSLWLLGEYQYKFVIILKEI